MIDFAQKCKRNHNVVDPPPPPAPIHPSLLADVICEQSQVVWALNNIIS